MIYIYYLQNNIELSDMELSCGDISLLTYHWQEISDVCPIWKNCVDVCLCQKWYGTELWWKLYINLRCQHTDHGLKKVVNTQTLHHMSIDFCRSRDHGGFYMSTFESLSELWYHQQEQINIIHKNVPNYQSFVMNDIMMTHHGSPSYPTTYPNIQDFFYILKGYFTHLWEEKTHSNQ